MSKVKTVSAVDASAELEIIAAAHNPSRYARIHMPRPPTFVRTHVQTLRTSPSAPALIDPCAGAPAYRMEIDAAITGFSPRQLPNRPSATYADPAFQSHAATPTRRKSLNVVIAPIRYLLRTSGDAQASPPCTISVSSGIPRRFGSLISAAVGQSTSSMPCLMFSFNPAVMVPVAVVRMDESHKTRQPLMRQLQFDRRTLRRFPASAPLHLEHIAGNSPCSVSASPSTSTTASLERRSRIAKTPSESPDHHQRSRCLIRFSVLVIASMRIALRIHHAPVPAGCRCTAPGRRSSSSFTPQQTCSAVSPPATARRRSTAICPPLPAEPSAPRSPANHLHFRPQPVQQPRPHAPAACRRSSQCS